MCRAGHAVVDSNKFSQFMLEWRMKLRTSHGLAAVFWLYLMGLPGPAAAQFSGTQPAGSPSLEMPGTAFQLPDLGEMFRPEILGLFAFNCVVVLAIASAIVFHPVRIKARRNVRDYELPRLFLLYGMIGMAIGFLVLQQGPIIGFVVFGIGGLLRFRSVLRNTTDTVEVILVTLLGLCVGLNLQNMAILIGLASWLLIWFFGRKNTYEIRLQHTSVAGLTAVMGDLEAAIKQNGWTLDRHRLYGRHSNTTDAKAAASVIFHSSAMEELSEVEDRLSAVLQGEEMEWRLK